MRTVIIITMVFANIALYAQKQTYIEEIKVFQEELYKEFKNSNKSPLTKKEQRKFRGHSFFPINEKLHVKAKFTRTLNPVPFKMQTTTERTPIYEKYGEVVFSIDDKQYKLNVYQSHRLRETEKYKNYLFLPFTDLTNGMETYEGGRYIDLSVPNSDSIIIDFNKAYNPYCAYSHTHSCPVPPEENSIPLKIKAGVKAFKK